MRADIKSNAHTQVVCVNQKLTGVPVNVSPDTRKLDLSGNKMPTVISDWFRSLSQLESLILSGNEIEAFQVSSACVRVCYVTFVCI